MYPALWSPDEDRERTLAEVERRPSDSSPPCDPPVEGRAHWEAVWRAFDASLHTPREKQEEDWPDEKELKALAGTLSNPPVPREDGDYRLIALVPAPPEVGPAWVAVYLHAQHRRRDLEGPRVRIERVVVAPGTRPAIHHVDARALVPVELLEFDEINPSFFAETVYEEDDEIREWHEADGFDRMPTTPEPYILSELYSYGSKIGGVPVHNAEYQEPPRSRSGQPMVYGLHLAADFFDCEFGDAGSLHVWLSPSSDEGAAVMDSA
jgi:hypothetical protein